LEPTIFSHRSRYRRDVNTGYHKRLLPTFDKILLDRDPNEVLAELAKTFSRNDATGATATLFYADMKNYECVWLFGHNKLLASSAISRSAVANLLPFLWSGLNVSTGNRAAGKRRNRGTGMNVPVLYRLIKAIYANYRLYADALKRTASVIVPEPIASFLAEDTTFVRLAVRPFGDIAKVPFAALPIVTLRSSTSMRLLLFPR
jgi:hypothetical protein